MDLFLSIVVIIFAVATVGEAATKQIALGGSHTCALLIDSTVKCWGAAQEGQLGYEDFNNRGNGPEEMGDKLPAVNLGETRTAVQITAGESHTCALLDDATNKCWGFGSDGKLGYGDTDRRGGVPGEMSDEFARS